METFALVPHPDCPAVAVEAVEARISVSDPHWLSVRWKIARAGKIVVPSLAGRGRADGLWQTTCFELFVREAEGYSEFNFSPSERWAAYHFSAYREGMRERPVARDPHCTWRGGSRFAIFDAAIPLAALPPLPWQCGLSAVIEEEGGIKSYWALAHPPGKPDFHHPACFAAMLAAPERS